MRGLLRADEAQRHGYGAILPSPLEDKGLNEVKADEGCSSS
jgi:hypothetical protein